jgi:polynucleotide 5'-kinase involved in rRNA processing
MDASSRAECLSDTRLDIIGFMKEFASRRNEEQNVMWLYGVAGSGKSTLATTVANYFREQGCLGALYALHWFKTQTSKHNTNF